MRSQRQASIAAKRRILGELSSSDESNGDSEGASSQESEDEVIDTIESSDSDREEPQAVPTNTYGEKFTSKSGEEWMIRPPAGADHGW